MLIMFRGSLLVVEQGARCADRETQVAHRFVIELFYRLEQRLKFWTAAAPVTQLRDHEIVIESVGRGRPDAVQRDARTGRTH